MNKKVIIGIGIGTAVVGAIVGFVIYKKRKAKKPEAVTESVPETTINSTTMEHVVADEKKRHEKYNQYVNDNGVIDYTKFYNGTTDIPRTTLFDDHDEEETDLDPEVTEIPPTPKDNRPFKYKMSAEESDQWLMLANDPPITYSVFDCGTITDEYDEPLSADEVEDRLGGENIRFDTDQEVIYIMNRETDTVYEIAKDIRTYDEMVAQTSGQWRKERM